ncbi:hypothetical protein [Streptomyces sp. NPDC126503]|uniref:hypothetical protein n=1 Tax=Streptomyces sp. NPDC126503 TaxID=3155315 RepID=UPI003325E21E
MNLQHKAGNYVNASWSMVRLRDLIYDMLGLLFTELSAHGGMAGDDNAGRAFAAVYKPAVKTVFEAAGLAHQVMANGAGAMLKATEDFLKQESAIAASLLGQSVGPDIGAQPSRPDCNPRGSHNAEELPEVVGETSWTDQYVLSSRFHGQRDKLRKTANAWRSAAASWTTHTGTPKAPGALRPPSSSARPPRPSRPSSPCSSARRHLPPRSVRTRP